MNQVVKATVIADSISIVSGKRITTIEAEFPRIILAEFNTHNAISKNASSSRAIPVPKMLDQVRNSPAMPARFGAANKGMQDAGEHHRLVDISGFKDGSVMVTPEQAWAYFALSAADDAERMTEAGYAKQICNRLIEPFQMMKVVMTATDWQNFLWLRDHGAADPTIEQLAIAIREALENSAPTPLAPGEWHTPYYKDGFWQPADGLECIRDDGEIVDAYGNTLQDALDISASCCAQVSFRSIDDTMEKARSVVAKLNLKGEEPNQPVHASPLEHQATPIDETGEYWDEDGEWGVNIMGKPSTWEKGITHVSRDGVFGSGNLWDWIQLRQLVPNHVKRG